MPPSVQYNSTVEERGEAGRAFADLEGIIAMRTNAAMVYHALGSGIIAISFGSILARLAQAPVPTVAALKMVFSFLILLPFVLASAVTRAELARLSCSDLRLLALSGLFLVLHFSPEASEAKGRIASGG